MIKLDFSYYWNIFFQISIIFKFKKNLNLKKLIFFLISKNFENPKKFFQSEKWKKSNWNNFWLEKIPDFSRIKIFFLHISKILKIKKIEFIKKKYLKISRGFLISMRPIMWTFTILNSLIQSFICFFLSLMYRNTVKKLFCRKIIWILNNFPKNKFSSFVLSPR